ncbi:hypothetical protein KBY27_22365 [Ruegeria pomeroyi]|uniref:Uncharacterized protein n=1 Tax=Ruegeria pomeroyi TaxID=89184 RepID=A0A9Q3WS91_9RHOB|nr:hypothetical protein [Ruegeria pomeroyi]MCE8540218.1 hypothetical protein [Ruegeria pomeroyi]
MSATIYQSTKFYHAREQYFAVAGEHTLLRLTLGSSGGRQGGAIKTATANDFGAPPVYRDRQALISAMRVGIQNLAGREVDLCIDIDGKGRWFAEICLPGTRDQLIELLTLLANEMARYLRRSAEDDHTAGCSDLRDLYDDLCIAEGVPVYLSDGMHLGSDGRLLQ